MTVWLLTSTFYGQWLPGDPRGSVTNTRDPAPPPADAGGSPAAPPRRERDDFGTPYESAIPGLHRAALEQMNGPPVAVTLAHAEELLDQFFETSRYRSYELRAVSVMFNHFHAVVEAPPTAGKAKLLGDFKSYGSRRLNAKFGRLPTGWWSDGGSCRPVTDAPSAIFYVCYRQPKPLLMWSRERGRIPPVESHPSNRWRPPPANAGGAP